MKITAITSFDTLAEYARELEEAKQSGDEALIAKAARRYDEYKSICLRNDVLIF